jgi:hypothetical protein
MLRPFSLAMDKIGSENLTIDNQKSFIHGQAGESGISFLVSLINNSDI